MHHARFSGGKNLPDFDHLWDSGVHLSLPVELESGRLSMDGSKQELNKLHAFVGMQLYRRESEIDMMADNVLLGDRASLVVELGLVGKLKIFSVFRWSHRKKIASDLERR